ncbi:transposase [Mangrovibacillus cuniculi]|uniref:Transposase IS200-like domain-containing protein n=1 Tax=Mangrovibacillus cuniculi TaxID=2593652 RepID=A0A7S8CCX8_9BACI|nr:transposase [Mangrovibacillus cuniculi]QPC47687.1 hypothetical protein G8O30_12335 [Mangrovibacillus cuniculi]
MENKIRDWEKDTTFHVILKSKKGMPIFKREDDYVLLLDSVEKSKKKYNFYLLSYSILNNHVHLVMETTNHSISDIMKGMIQSFVNRYNFKYDLKGNTLLEKPFWSRKLLNNEQIINACIYSDLNAVKAGLVTAPEEYMWSSHYDIISPTHNKIPYADREQLLKYVNGKSVNLYKSKVNTKLIKLQNDFPKEKIHS